MLTLDKNGILYIQNGSSRQTPILCIHPFISQSVPLMPRGRRGGSLQITWSSNETSSWEYVRIIVGKYVEHIEAIVGGDFANV